jgi:hypothetical protein
LEAKDEEDMIRRRRDKEAAVLDAGKGLTEFKASNLQLTNCHLSALKDWSHFELVVRRILALGLEDLILLAIFAGQRKSRISDPRNRVFTLNLITHFKILSQKKKFFCWAGLESGIESSLSKNGKRL